jgi:hypothetical protein
VLDELTSMSESSERALAQAIATISQSDPIIKLLQQVALGRMQPTDAGLRAITDAWLGTYRKVIETTPLSPSAMMRLDPRPRIDFLIDVGVLDPSNEAGQSLRTTFEKRLAQMPPD